LWQLATSIRVSVIYLERETETSFICTLADQPTSLRDPVCLH